MEIHVTVEPTDVKRFKDACDTVGVKAIVIESLNSKGADSWQFVTGCWTTAELVESRMQEIAIQLEADGFKVIRKKIETYLSTDAAGIYLEAHITCTKIDDELMNRYGLAASRKVNDERVIVTLRRKGMEKDAFSSLVDEIAAQMPSENVLRVHKETCLLDDNEALDDGWIQT